MIVRPQKFISLARREARGEGPFNKKPPPRPSRPMGVSGLPAERINPPDSVEKEQRWRGDDFKLQTGDIVETNLYPRMTRIAFFGKILRRRFAKFADNNLAVYSGG
jgi:hypothetical protein